MDTRMPKKKKPSRKRQVPKNSIALRYALECSIDLLRVAAITVISGVAREEHGAIGAIRKRLGVSKTTWWRWTQAVPELAAVIERAGEAPPNKGRTLA